MGRVWPRRTASATEPELASPPAGQHVHLGVPIGGRRFTRTYSISSSPERHSGPFRRQLGTTTRKIWRYALPGGQDRVSEAPALRAA